MKKVKKIVILFIIVLLSVTTGKIVMAQNSGTIAKKVQYTEEYQKWLELTDEEKEKQIQPRKYLIETEKNNIINGTNNIFKIRNMLKSSTNSDYTLKDVIPDNMKVKNQKETNSCWAFATLGALETNLAIQDSRNSNPLKIYDFSERHMVYASSRIAFLGEQINTKGYNKLPSSGGNFYLAQTYLTNGNGAITESQMPFENNENNIEISSILNKDIVTTLYDTIEFEKPLSSEKEATIEKMKTHITNYGALYAGIHGASDILNSEYYNNDTGALYCNTSFMAPIDHAVIIVGWDDNYSKTKFNSDNQPQNNGAWIIRNSWGEKDVIVLEEFKEELFGEYEDDFKQKGIISASQIPDEVVIKFLEEEGYTKQTDGTYSLKIGDNGYMYVSYEDVNIYSTLFGVQKAKAEKDYKNVYQNDVLGCSNLLYFYNLAAKKYYLANTFQRSTQQNESIDRISVYTTKDYNNCKVYVNPNGNSKSKENWQEASLKLGENVDIAPGYHTIEFEEPIKLTGNSFVVILEVEADGYFYMTMESKSEGGWEYAEVNANESFFATDIDLQNNKWSDTAKWTKADFNDTSSDTKDEDYQGNVNIKAYTVATTVSDDSNNEDNSNTDNNENDNNNNNDGNNQENNGEQNKEEIKRQPTPSDFTDATAIVTDANIDVDSEENKTNMSIEISNIKIGDEENTYTYYYYLSDSKDKDNIEEEYWIEVSPENVIKKDDGTFSIILYIDKDQLKNFEDIENSENLYLLMKEVAEIDGNKTQSINDLKITLDVEPDIDQGDNNEQQQEPIKKEDDTIANIKIPFAGKISIIIAIISVISLGSFTYFRYKNIDR